jgi:hypothetical protein
MFGLSRFFGYDIFISYRRDEASRYAQALRDRLKAADFSCFLDLDEAPPGERLSSTLERALRHSQMLVFAGTRSALSSPWIQRELAFYRKVCGDRRRMILLNVGSALRARTPEFAYLDELIWINEHESAVERGEPSDAVLDGIQRSYSFGHRNAFRRGAVSATIALLVAFSMLAVWQAVRASAAQRLAERERDHALKILQWIVAETVRFDPDQSDLQTLTPEGRSILGGLISRLADLDFRGAVIIEGHLGQYCIVPGSASHTRLKVLMDSEQVRAASARVVGDFYIRKEDGSVEKKSAVLDENPANTPPRLAADSLPINQCEIFPDEEYALGLADLQSVRVKEFLQTLRTPPSIELKSMSYGIEQPRHLYPKRGTAAEWNAVARANNGIQIKIVEAGRPD